ncbi:MAG: WYL domain-containing protein [Rubellimicrobium sp.]|nr:WYL domain-containing protein [Rubellimicrobium sp.]
MSFVKAEQLYRMAEMAAARRRGISLRHVMDEFRVEERTARRMLRKFEDLFEGVETSDDDGRRRWWSLTDVPYIQHRVLRDNELAALELAIRRAARDGADTEAKALETARDRLVASYSRPMVRGATGYSEILLLANGFASRPGPTRKVSEDYLNLLFTSFRRPTMVEIVYQGAHDPEPRRRLVEPHAVIVGTRHYLIARDTDADREYRQFRFDRILEMQATVRVFERDPDFDVERYSAQAFGSFFSDAEHGLVRWRFAPGATAAAREFVFHPTQQMTELDDGSLLVEFTASGWLEMAWHLVKWGSNVEVLEPPELRTMLDRVRRGEVKILP